MIFTRLKEVLRDRKFWKYTGSYLALMIILYLFAILGSGLATPGFTYAAF